MGSFLEATVKLLSACVIKNIAVLVLPKGGIAETAKTGINAVLLLLTVETVMALWEGIWNF